MGDSRARSRLPDRPTPARYLWWLITSQRRRALLAAFLSTVWMVGLTLIPYLLSRTIDYGLASGRLLAMTGWCAALLGAGVLNAWLGITRHRTMTRLRLEAGFRTVRTVLAQAARLGAVLPRRITAGEVVTIGISDVLAISRALTWTGPGVGAVFAYAAVAGLLFSVSALLAVVVLLGVPLLAVLVGPLLRRQEGAVAAYRESQGQLAARFTDIAGGLRVLSGLGGKDVYAARYRAGSQELCERGYRVGAVTSWIEAFGVGLPALFLGAVTWLAARMAAQGAISVGQLVAVYGYVTVLVVPVEFFIEGGGELTTGLVSARRITRFLALEPACADPTTGADAPAAPSVLRDPASGVEVVPGRLTALAGDGASRTAEIVDRLGRFTDSAAMWGTVRLGDVALEQVRDRILVADNEAHLFAGPLRDLLAGRRDPDDDAVLAAVRAAMAHDVVRGLPDGLDSAVDAQGRNLSGGQRQRLRLARALLADPEVLMAVEPTSAVDAHTESAMARGLRRARSGRTTVVTTTSPLLLDQADTVHFLVHGRVVASGTHRELLHQRPDYRLLVSRGEYPAEPGPGPEPQPSPEPGAGTDPVSEPEESVR